MFLNIIVKWYELAHNVIGLLNCEGFFNYSLLCSRGSLELLYVITIFYKYSVNVVYSIRCMLVCCTWCNNELYETLLSFVLW